MLSLIVLILVDLLGILGAVLVAIPFLNESSLKKLRGQLSSGVPVPGFERAEAKAQEVVATKLSQFSPGDRACVIFGLIAIGVSYGLHLIAELARYFSS